MDIRVALVYPNEYRVAMSNLGYQIIYNILNDRNDTFCERFTYPHYRSLETNSPLSDFKVIAFSLQYEEDYFNMVKILSDNNIPLNRKDRNRNTDPLIIAGGTCASSNPSVISDFVDVFIVGDAELILDEVFDNLDKDFEYLSSIPGVYIPDLDNCVELQLVDNLDNAYMCDFPIISETDEDYYKSPFRDSILLNISRGCSRGCRFCMSSYLYRPKREASADLLFDYCKKIRNDFGLNKVVLIGAAVSDYNDIGNLVNSLEEDGFVVSVPSMRIESITYDILLKLRESGLKTLTVAPETIPRLRRRINKDINDDVFFKVINDAVSLGFNIKYYFLIGLPYETSDDIDELIEYIQRIDKLKNTKDNNIKMTFSINPLIPKPHTPIQWFKYDLKSNKKKIKHMKKSLKGIDVKFDSARMGLIQYILSCGNSTVGKLIEKKALKGNVTIKEWENQIPTYKINDKLPWNNIKIPTDKDFLKEEYNKITNNQVTPWCEEEGCYNCGACTPKKMNNKE